MQVDNELSSIADYVCDHTISNQTALSTARYCILDAIGCAILALKFDNCTKLLGPIVPGTVVPGGVRVPGTPHVLDPVTAAFNIGTMVRWLDYNDTWLAAEWGHPSDNVGAILAVADYISQQRVAEGKEPLTMKTVMEALIKAYEIQGVLALENSLNQVGLDHVLFVKVASTALATHLLGGNKEQITAALSNAFIDGAALRTYRHAPNTGSRKSWAAGDATSRAVWHAFNAIKGEMGYPTALTARGWGFYDVLFRGNPFRFQRPYDEYVMENVFFKVAFPAEFHAQTAVECAFKLHPEVKDRLSEVAKVHIKTHKSAIRIIDKKGTLRNPADRDHCLQYMVAVALIYGHLTADHYEDDVALSDLRIDELREKMIVTEDVSYSQDYLDPNKRSIANGLQIEFTDGTKTDFVEIHFPIGHRRRREEAIPLIEKKFQQNIASHFSEQHVKDICRVCLDADTFENTPVSDFVTLFLPNN